MTLENQQLALEQLVIDESITKFNLATSKAIKQGSYDSTKMGNRLVLSRVLQVSKAIEDFIADDNRPKRYAHAALGLQVLPSKVLALISLRVLVATIGQRKTHSNTVSTLVMTIKDEITFRNLKSNTPGLFYYFENMTKEAGTQSRKQTTRRLKGMTDQLDIAVTNKKDLLTIGLALIEIVMDTTGYFELVTVGKAKNSEQLFLPTLAGAKWLKNAEDSASLLMPLLQPMVVTPKPWTTLEDGGYLTRKSSFIRTSDKEYLEELANYDTSVAMLTANAASATPWKINKPVLGVLEHLWYQGGDICGLPPSDDIPKPCEFNESWDKPEKQKWIRAEASRHRINAKLEGKRVATTNTLTIANRFKDYENIYFPHNLDWRGRVYPLPVFLQPQGNDVAKGLLQFSKGVPLGSEGVKWLAIHIANTYGYDKASFADRIKWTYDHSDEILESAMNPLDGQKFWMDADDPFMFLAASFEWLGYSIQGEDYESHLSINLDGAANGMQHLSALILDEEGGKATCLVPMDKPADIYTAVRLAAEEQIQKDVSEGNLVATRLLGRVTRSMAKPATMRKPYGATLFGLKDVIREELLAEGLIIEGAEDEMELVWYATKVMNDAVENAVTAAKVVMEFLQDTAKVVATAGLPVWWINPLGVPICQKYLASSEARVETLFMGKRVRTLIYTDNKDILNGRKQVSGISPNYIHSLDAAHMQATVKLCVEHGLKDFCLIHDSYGTHAANVGTLAALLREAFITMYSKDVLWNFLNDIKDQLVHNPELLELLPKLPEKGLLDLESIRDSEYFFA